MEQEPNETSNQFYEGIIQFSNNRFLHQASLEIIFIMIEKTLRSIHLYHEASLDGLGYAIHFRRKQYLFLNIAKFPIVLML